MQGDKQRAMGHGVEAVRGRVQCVYMHVCMYPLIPCRSGLHVDDSIAPSPHDHTLDETQVKHLLTPGGNEEARKKAEKEKTTDADVIQFSGCRDDQTSADTKVDGACHSVRVWISCCW